jgi:hypothetical protein
VSGLTPEIGMVATNGTSTQTAVAAMTGLAKRGT